MINIIAVIGKNRELGCDDKLLWDIPEDMARFKKITSGHTVVMGRKTFESIGKALPNRRNIVVTRNKNYQATGCETAHSLKDALNLEKNQEIFVIGGGEIYAQALSLADKLYLTIVDDAPKADTFFPDYSVFKNNIKEEGHETNGLKYKFIELRK